MITRQLHYRASLKAALRSMHTRGVRAETDLSMHSSGSTPPSSWQAPPVAAMGRL